MPQLSQLEGLLWLYNLFRPHFRRHTHTHLISADSDDESRHPAWTLMWCWNLTCFLVFACFFLTCNICLFSSRPLWLTRHWSTQVFVSWLSSQRSFATSCLASTSTWTLLSNACCALMENHVAWGAITVLIQAQTCAVFSINCSVLLSSSVLPLRQCKHWH